MALLLLFQGGLEPLRAFRPGHTQSSASEGADGSATILEWGSGALEDRPARFVQAYSAGGKGLTGLLAGFLDMNLPATPINSALLLPFLHRNSQEGMTAERQD